MGDSRRFVLYGGYFGCGGFKEMTWAEVVVCDGGKGRLSTSAS